ncbi:TPA: hypothetical protein DIS60_00940, partial [Patescibacteria group bacterium]|nr:hypothetical protein [Patescibacteria group bacterium]
MKQYNKSMSDTNENKTIPTDQLVSLLLALKEDAQHQIDESDASYEEIRQLFFGKESELTHLTQFMRFVPKEDKQRVG